MITTQQKQAEELAKLIKHNSTSTNAIPIYLSALLFAIALNIFWLIITFSCLLGISVIFKLNKTFNFIKIKHK